MFYEWDLTKETGRKYDIYNAPALQKGGPKDPLTTPSQYLTFELDVEAGRFRAFQRVGSGWGKIMHEKPLNRTAPPPALPLAPEAGGAGSVRVLAADLANVVPPHYVV